MSLIRKSYKPLLLILIAASVSGCDESGEEKSAQSAAEPAAASAKPAPTPAPTPEPPPKPKPRDDCPEGSSGIGTFDEPCMASGDSRMMEVEYTGKTTDQGPKFKVINKSKLPILHGSIVVYFYDKSGKQLEVAGSEEHKQKQTCSGNIFAGAVKPGEKIYVFFSCVKESHIPEGTKKIEAEIQRVGFADESGKHNEFYWQNPDLVPDERPVGGVKFPKKGKKKKK